MRQSGKQNHGRFPRHKSFIDELLKAKIADCVCARVCAFGTRKYTLSRRWRWQRVGTPSQLENGTNSSFDDLFYIIETIATVLTLNIFAHFNRNCVYLCDRKPFPSPAFRSRLSPALLLPETRRRRRRIVHFCVSFILLFQFDFQRVRYTPLKQCRTMCSFTRPSAPNTLQLFAIRQRGQSGRGKCARSNIIDE